MTVIEIEGSYLLNGITSDHNGFLYVTCSVGNKIFKVNTDGYDYSVFINSGLIYPNGITYQRETERLAVMNSGASGAPIQWINIHDSTDITTEIYTNITQTDGLIIGAEGWLYFSSWNTGCVYTVDPSNNPPYTVISWGHSGPADIYYNPIDRMLAVPNFNSNSLSFVYMPPLLVDGFVGEEVGGLRIISASTNHADRTIKICYQSNHTAELTINLYSLDGKLVWSEERNADRSSAYHETIYPGHLNPGMYILEISSPKDSVSQKFLY
jgi:hypothetical protein